MAKFKEPRIGVYSDKDRAFQSRVSFEKTSLTWHPVNVFKYLGVKTNEVPDVTDIQDPILLENVDRKYDTTPVKLNAWMEYLPESQFDLSKFGIINPLGNTMQFRFHTESFKDEGLGRYIRVADIIEVPFWEQDGTKSYWEVTDVDRKPEFENFIIIVTAEPMKDSTQTLDIPDKNTNEDLLDALAVSIEADQDEVFSQGGLDAEPSLYVYRDYVVDEYTDAIEQNIFTDEETIRTTYDPRPNNTEDWLDNPDKVVY